MNKLEKMVVRQTKDALVEQIRTLNTDNASDLLLYVQKGECEISQQEAIGMAEQLESQVNELQSTLALINNTFSALLENS